MDKLGTTTPKSAAADSDAPSKRPPTPAKDLEYGRPDDDRPLSQASSKRSNLPEENDPDSEPWGLRHPCYPHRNPHVPLDSPLYESTRIIRIPRDWMEVGDLAPTYSIIYPMILENWVTDEDFWVLIRGVNERLINTFTPFSWRNWADGVMGVLTGWIWEDIGMAAAKKGCRDVEAFIEEWNALRRTEYMEKDEDTELIRVIPLRRTAYLSLDIQIPNPGKIMLAEDGRRGSEGGKEREEEENRRQISDAGREDRKGS